MRLQDLDRPVLAALTGPHRRFAATCGAAIRYDPAVTPFAAMVDDADGSAWSDLGALARGEAVALLDADPARIPPGWTVQRHLECLQLVETTRLRPPHGRFPGVIALGVDDVPDMLDLVDRTRPGPFLPRTVELGGYVGVRDAAGRLVAMAGRRLAVGGHREVSGVCTDPAFRGRGLARRLIETVVTGVHAEGEQAFLHVVAANPAVGLYESMGFAVRRPIDILVVQESHAQSAAAQ